MIIFVILMICFFIGYMCVGDSCDGDAAIWVGVLLFVGVVLFFYFLFQRDENKKEENIQNGLVDLKNKGMAYSNKQNKFYDLTIYSAGNQYGFIYSATNCKKTLLKNKNEFEYNIELKTGFNSLYDIENLLPLAAASAFTSVGVIFNGDVEDNAIEQITLVIKGKDSQETIPVYSGSIKIDNESIKELEKFTAFVNRLTVGDY